MIIVNSKGRRFTDETAGRHEIAGAVLKETQEGPCFSIASSRALEAFDPISLKNLYRGRYAGQAWKADTPEALAVKNACLLSHHGVLAAGKSLQAALTLAVEVENLAHQYVVVCQLGKPKLISYEEMNEVLRSFRTYGQQSVEGESK